MVNLMGALEALPPTQRDVCAFALSSSVMLATVESVKLCASKGLFDRHFTRKLMHIAVGPIFLLLWPLFSGEGSSHLWAAAVPLAMTAKFALTGLGLLDSEADVDAMSRTGQREELLRGPLLYGLVFVCSTALAFRTVASAASLMALCAGDGMADVIGRAVGTHKLPWSSRKSWAGSLAFVCFAFAGSSLFSAIFYVWGWSPTPLSQMLAPLLLASAAAAAVESLPFADVDNVLAPAVFVLVLRLAAG